MSKKINLAAVEARPSLFEAAKTVNLARDLGNIIYFNAATIPDLRFGERLFDSTGEIEVSDEELSERLKHIKRPEDHPATGFMAAYRSTVNGVNTGCTWLY